MLMPNPDFPKLSRLLPAMASDEVQNNWTGTHGYRLLGQTCNFVRSLSYNYTSITGKSLRDARVLDFGCGYGRIARLMYYFIDTANVVGVDPWDRSIEECRTANLGPNFLQSEYLPTSLPVGDVTFDLVYAFSVFTHLSRRAFLQALETIRRYVKPGGVLCITIRPAEYWDYESPTSSPSQREELKRAHFLDGFAFIPHNVAPIDGDLTYGDTSVSLAWLDQNSPGWQRVGIDRSLDDALQIYVFLKAV
jgi:SAM-dependent methyltransferase